MTDFNVQEFIDSQPLRRAHFAILAICGMVMFVDGFDVFVVGKILPAIAHGLGQPLAAMNQLALAQQVGLVIGAFAAPALADRYGRRSVLLVSLAAFGALTIGCALSTSLIELAALRFLSGIFLSGGLPVAVSLIAEATPGRRRGTFIALSFATYSTGSAASGAIAAWMINDYGWKSAFWIGGALPLLLLPFLWGMPESLQLVVSRNPASPASRQC